MEEFQSTPNIQLNLIGGSRYIFSRIFAIQKGKNATILWLAIFAKPTLLQATEELLKFMKVIFYALEMRVPIVFRWLQIITHD